MLMREDPASPLNASATGLSTEFPSGRRRIPGTPESTKVLPHDDDPLEVQGKILGQKTAPERAAGRCDGPTNCLLELRKPSVKVHSDQLSWL
jgi:hypothetical protein